MAKLEKLLLNWEPVRWMIKRSKRVALPGFRGICLHDVMKVFLRECNQDRLGDRAAAISFNFLVAIPPTFIFLFTLVPYIPLQNIETTLYQLTRDLTPTYNTYKVLHDLIYDFLHTQRTGLLSFSFLLGFFYSSNGVLGIMRAFDKIHPGFLKRNLIQRRWVALKLTTVLILLVIFSISLIIAQNTILGYLFKWLGIKNIIIKLFINLARWIIIVFLFFTMISFIYREGPATKKRWRFLTPGSLLATALTILITLGFSYYVNHFGNYNKIYGSIGTILVLMLWIYFNSYALLIGFELNASIEAAAEEKTQQALVEKLPEISPH